MKTEEIIKTLQDWKRIWKPTGEVALTLDAAIEELKFSENKLRLVVARQNEVIQRLKEERDEARNEIKRLKNGSYLQSLSMSHAKSALNNFSK